MKARQTIKDSQFVACAQPFWLLRFLIDAARRATAGGRFGKFNYSTGGHFRSHFMPLNRKLNFKFKQPRNFSREIFGAQKSKTNNNLLEERTHLRLNP
jgi:hypothetical protein